MKITSRLLFMIDVKKDFRDDFADFMRIKVV